MGRSFGYNRIETDEHHISTTELIHIFIDIVSKNGNLLLNVGPMADGSIPELQLKRLKGLGDWLKVNGEAVFDTRPWLRAEGKTAHGIPVRYTRKEAVLYAILLGMPSSDIVKIPNCQIDKNSEIHLLGHEQPLHWEQRDTYLQISWPTTFKTEHALSFRITY
jgi:alpha-L-fucosidase